MSNDKHINESEQTARQDAGQPVDNTAATEAEIFESNQEDEGSELESLKNLLDDRDRQLEKEKKEYMFLMAEFDNFRKRNVRERADLLKNAAEGVLKGLLPIVDDFERGLEATKETTDAESVRQGMELIYQKLIKYLEQNGVKALDTSAGTEFDTSWHEAIALVPGPEELKGKIIDTVSKGYTLNDKVLRHAKVAVGQ